jgi:hypothetical protein
METLALIKLYTCYLKESTHTRWAPNVWEMSTSPSLHYQRQTVVYETNDFICKATKLRSVVCEKIYALSLHRCLLLGWGETESLIT